MGFILVAEIILEFQFFALNIISFYHIFFIDVLLIGQTNRCNRINGLI